MIARYVVDRQNLEILFSPIDLGIKIQPFSPWVGLQSARACLSLRLMLRR